MAPPSGKSTVTLRTWSTDGVYYACESEHSKLPRAICDSTRAAVLRRLEGIVGKQLRAFCEQEWPYYVEELVGGTSFEIIDEECPCCSPARMGRPTIREPLSLPMMLPRVADAP